jgi:hypothetical protein
MFKQLIGMDGIVFRNKKDPRIRVLAMQSAVANVIDSVVTLSTLGRYSGNLGSFMARKALDYMLDSGQAFEAREDDWDEDDSDRSKA